MAKVATITLNAAYDLVGRLPRIEIGEVNTVETLGLFPAGKPLCGGRTGGDRGGGTAQGQPDRTGGCPTEAAQYQPQNHQGRDGLPVSHEHGWPALGGCCPL